MKNKKTVTVLGTLVAIALPAATILAFETPHSFEAGSLISASEMNENFAAISAELTALRTELDEVKAKQAFGGVVDLDPLTTTRVAAIYQVPSDGVLLATPDGGDFGNITTVVRVGNGVDSASVTVNCDGQLCPFNRQSNGDATATVVRAGGYVMVRALGIQQTTATVSLSWFSLRGDDSVPTLAKEE